MCREYPWRSVARLMGDPVLLRVCVLGLEGCTR